jgi:hypothetical protein
MDKTHDLNPQKTSPITASRDLRCVKMQEFCPPEINFKFTRTKLVNRPGYGTLERPLEV